MKSFALIGAAGYVAPRHLRAIQETGNRLVAAYDPFDSVGILDSYFPEAAFFTEYERFDRHLDKLRRGGNAVDYVSVCSPNYLHDAHVRFGLRQGASVICEKPLVLNPWNVDALAEATAEAAGSVYSILQLRLHPAVIALRERVRAAPAGTVHDVDLTYLTARGNWYYGSWKGRPEKSGGVATNIGIHFFDLLLWVFGPVRSSVVYRHTHDRAAGYLHLERARVSWFLAIDPACLAAEPRSGGGRTFRSLTCDGEEINFTSGFEDLHTTSYREVLAGRGFGIQENRAAIALAASIRSAPLNEPDERAHPLARLKPTPHPFNPPPTTF